MPTVIDQIAIDKPAFHEGGTSRWSALPEILSTLERVAGPSTRSVETGCGASTVVFAATGGQHTVISPDSREHYLVKRYCDQIGVDYSNVTFIAKSSDNVLPQLVSGRSLDLVFIDGAHSFPYAIVDWHYLSLGLKLGGHMLVDDVAIPAVAPVFHFMKSDPGWQLESLPDDRAALFSLLREPLEDNYTLQPFNRRNDYSFAPLATRAKLVSASLARSSRRSVGRRFPALREAYRRLGPLT